MNQVAKSLLSEDEKAVFQLFELITKVEGYKQWTDQKSYLMMQSDENAPIWIWLGEGLWEVSKESEEILCALSDCLCRNPSIHFNAVLERFSKLSARLEERIHKKVTMVMPMNVYVCTEPYMGNERGRMLQAEREHTDEMKRLLIQLVWDGEHARMTDEVAEQVVDSMITSKNVYLWEVDGKICSMAMLAHRGIEFSRINTVVTERSQRGNGYAAMLVAAMCREELQKGKKVMLYADANNPSSNRTYQKIGFQSVGQIAEYKVK